MEKKVHPLPSHYQALQRYAHRSERSPEIVNPAIRLLTSSWGGIMRKLFENHAIFGEKYAIFFDQKAKNLGLMTKNQHLILN